jgi:hypothetical protein
MLRRIQKTQHELPGPPQPPHRSLTGHGGLAPLLAKSTNVGASHVRRLQPYRTALLVFLPLASLILFVRYSGTGSSLENLSHDSKSNGTAVHDVLNEFYQRYGGKEKAQQIYQRGIQSFGSSKEHTAHRFLRILASSDPSFVMSFAGYSVTVGRGNHYKQSYPFVLERILQPLILSEFNIQLTVRNAAIGGIPSFPYGFCLTHFLGRDANVVSWDYSMNEGKGSAVLEAYIRQSQSQLSSTQPMMIVLDTNAARCELVKSYIESNLLLDGMCVGMAKDAVSNLQDLLQEETLPIGFQDWDEFGAAPSCPGRGNWHPKKMEHELIGWMIAMYFVEAMQIAKQIIKETPNWKALYAIEASQLQTYASNPVEFPPPLSVAVPRNDDSVTGLLYGHPNPQRDADGKAHRMHHVACRTNFLPATNIDNILPSIVVDGLNMETTADNIMTERTDGMYKSGWVLDVSSVERDTKVKVEQCGGLGYVDMKIALYGIPESGVLRLWLPVESKNGKSLDSLLASDWVNELIICEANEKRAAGACRLDADISYTVGGQSITAPSMIHGAAEYLKRQTCVHIGIPPTAQMTKLSDVRPKGESLTLSEAVVRRLAGPQMHTGDHLGLVLDIKAKDIVSREKGACCISHVVWEERS